MADRNWNILFSADNRGTITANDLSAVELVRLGLKDLGESLPKVLAIGLTKPAYAAKNQAVADMPRYLDRPTPFIKNSLFVFPAEKEENPVKASVQFKWDFGRVPRHLMGTTEAPASMRSQVYGAPRPFKSSEKTLQRSGIMPANRQYLVPSKVVKKNQYGNVTGATMNKILYTGVKSGSASNNGMGGDQIKFFALTKNGQNVGIFERMANDSIRPMLFFVDRPKYKERYPFYAIINRVVDRDNLKNISDALEIQLAKLKK